MTQEQKLLGIHLATVMGLGYSVSDWKYMDLVSLKMC